MLGAPGAERLTPVAREALVRANWRAVVAGRNEVTPEDLLDGVLRARPCLGVWLLADVGVDVAALLHQLGPTPPVPLRLGLVAQVPVAEATRATVQRAVYAADELGHAHVGSEHLVLAFGHLVSDPVQLRSLVAERVGDARHPHTSGQSDVARDSPWAPELACTWLDEAAQRFAGGSPSAALEAVERERELAERVGSSARRFAADAAEAGILASRDCTYATCERVVALVNAIPVAMSDARCGALLAAIELALGRAELERAETLIDAARSSAHRPGDRVLADAAGHLVTGLRGDPDQALASLDTLAATLVGTEVQAWARPVGLVAVELEVLCAHNAEAARRLADLGADHRDRRTSATERAVGARVLAALGDRRTSASLASLREREPRTSEAWIDATVGLAHLARDTRPAEASALAEEAVAAATTAGRRLLELDARIEAAALARARRDDASADAALDEVHEQATSLGVSVLARRSARPVP